MYMKVCIYEYNFMCVYLYLCMSQYMYMCLGFLFVYVSLSLDPIIKPNHIHSRSINELKNMTQNLSAILDFKSRSQRTNLKDFKNDTPSSFGIIISRRIKSKL